MPTPTSTRTEKLFWLLKQTKGLKKMSEIKYDTEYFEGITAPYIDWVGGGNFDGYLIQKSLVFKEHDKNVELHTKVVNAKRYDGSIFDSVLIGNYRQTDKETITLTFVNFEMRGEILGDHDEIIAFSVWCKKTLNRNEVYKFKQ